MAALTSTLSLALAVGLLSAAGRVGRADEPPAPAPATSATTVPAETTAATSKVELYLAIAGLGPQGCDVEIKPAHPGCKFRTVVQHVSQGGKAKVAINDAQSRSADRDCTFAITIREPGHADRTVHRGLRLLATATPTAQLLSCNLSSPSRLARTQGAAAMKR